MLKTPSQQDIELNAIDDNSGAAVIGSNGCETLVFLDLTDAFKTGNITIDQSVERIELQYPIDCYSFKAVDNILLTYCPKDQLIFKVPVMSGGGLELAFPNGAGSVDFSSGVITIGGEPVANTAPATMKSALLDGSPSSTSWELIGDTDNRSRFFIGVDFDFPIL
ncbi:MAG: hypothetical protein BWK73_10495 [Thiothrix lacustris]|uniref:Uncharacterized protein n=1 Tax=Thiothrix lacustris TaxID=525917 RepID=A0A1Y1QUJ1_9GAMM|nr:MAG: hypothetical protein BWK73_10495 [Thiothrix lacustris]